MDESDRSSRERVPTCVGFSLPGGGLVVYFGSQRSALAVVSLLAIASGEGEAVFVREEVEEPCCAVFEDGKE
jgi:hypothetical protein